MGKKFLSQSIIASGPLNQVRQFSNIHRNPSRLITQPGSSRLPRELLQIVSSGSACCIASKFVEFATAMDWIVKIPVSGGNPGKAEVFTNSINGCDGIAIDGSDDIWVAANQADEIVVVVSTGKANGVSGGITQGLLFPASPAFSPDGTTLYVTNLELDLRTLGPNNSGPQTVDSQWAHEVTTHSIAKLPATILGP